MNPSKTVTLSSGLDLKLNNLPERHRTLRKPLHNSSKNFEKKKIELVLTRDTK